LIGRKLEEFPVENKHALILSDSVIEAMRQATIEMKDSKYLKDDAGDADDKDDQEEDADKEMFKKRTHKNKGFSSGSAGGAKSNKSFARKRQRVR
jgi:hypothetical protein